MSSFRPWAWEDEQQARERRSAKFRALASSAVFRPLAELALKASEDEERAARPLILPPEQMPLGEEPAGEPQHILGSARPVMQREPRTGFGLGTEVSEGPFEEPAEEPTPTGFGRSSQLARFGRGEEPSLFKQLASKALETGQLIGSGAKRGVEEVTAPGAGTRFAERAQRLVTEEVLTPPAPARKALEKVGRGAEWWEENVIAPISSLVGAAVSVPDFIRDPKAPGRKFIELYRKEGGTGGFDPAAFARAEYKFNQELGREGLAPKFLKNAPAEVQLAWRVVVGAAFDPLNLVPGLGFTKVEDIGRLGAAAKSAAARAGAELAPGARRLAMEELGAARIPRVGQEQLVARRRNIGRRADLIPEIESVGASVDLDGTIIVYHATTADKVPGITSSGVLKVPEGAPDTYGVYVSTSEQVARDYGDGTIIAMRVPLKDLNPDDIFPGQRMDFRINTRRGIYKPIEFITEQPIETAGPLFQQPPAAAPGRAALEQVTGVKLPEVRRPDALEMLTGRPALSSEERALQEARRAASESVRQQAQELLDLAATSGMRFPKRISEKLGGRNPGQYGLSVARKYLAGKGVKLPEVTKRIEHPSAAGVAAEIERAPSIPPTGGGRVPPIEPPGGGMVITDRQGMRFTQATFVDRLPDRLRGILSKFGIGIRQMPSGGMGHPAGASAILKRGRIDVVEGSGNLKLIGHEAGHVVDNDLGIMEKLASESDDVLRELQQVLSLGPQAPIDSEAFSVSSVLAFDLSEKVADWLRPALRQGDRNSIAGEAVAEALGRWIDSPDDFAAISPSLDRIFNKLVFEAHPSPAPPRPPMGGGRIPPGKPPAPPTEPPYFPTGGRPSPGSYEDSLRVMRQAVGEQLRQRRTGKVAEQIGKGRQRQVATFREALAQAEAEGHQGMEAVKVARRGLAGALTEMPPLERVAPEHWDAVVDKIRGQYKAGEIRDFQFINEVSALQRLREGGAALQPNQIDKLRHVLGQDLTDLLVERQSSIAGVQREQIASIQQLAERLGKEREVLEATGQPFAAAQRKQQQLLDILARPGLTAGQADRARLGAISALNRLDEAEIARTEAYLKATEAKRARIAESAAKKEYRDALAQAESHDKLWPNEGQIIAKAKARLGEIPGISMALNRETLKALEYTIRGNRAVLDGLKSEMGGLFQTVRSALTGDLPDSFLTGLAYRRASLASVLTDQLGDVKLARQVADDMMERELLLRYGPLERTAGKLVPPEKVAKILAYMKNLPYEQSPGLMDTAVQRAKNTAFGFDLGIFGIQALAAVNEGNVPLMAGLINRMLALAHLPHVRVNYADIASKKIAYTLDGLERGVGASAVKAEEGTLLSFIPLAGKKLDIPIVAITDMLNRLQFSGILGMIRNLAYEGNLALLHLARQDIRNAAVRATAARNANALSSYGQVALTTGRRTSERILLTSAPMTRSQAALILQVSKVFRPGATAAERIVGATTILSMAGSTLLIGKLINDRVGIAEFQFDPSKPGFGVITLHGGRNVNLFPQLSVVKATARSIRELADVDVQAAAKSWGRLILGRTSIVGETIGAAAGAGYEPGRGFRFGDLGEGKGMKGKILNMVPMPPVIQSVLSENPDALSLAMEAFGVSEYPESAYATKNRLAQQRFKKPYTDLWGPQKQAVDKDPQVLRAEAAQPPTERGWQQYEALESERLAEEQKAVDIYKRTGNGEAFREQVSDVQGEFATRRSQVDDDFKLFKQTSKLPDDPNKRARVEYYDAYDTARLPGGKLDYDVLDAEMARLEKSWTSEQKAYVESFLGLTEHVPGVQQLYVDKKKLEPYWEIADKEFEAIKKRFPEVAQFASYDVLKKRVKEIESDPRLLGKNARLLAAYDVAETLIESKREVMRIRDKEIDRILVKYYGRTPIIPSRQPVGAGSR